MEVVLGVPFGYEPNDELKKLLEDFREMINFCIDYACRRRITSYAKLRKGVYEEWKRRWDYSTHFCHSACKIALVILKKYRKKHREGKPEAKKLFMQLDPMLYRFYGDRIRISVRPRQFLFIDLKFGEYQKKFIDAWKEGKLKTGEITVNEDKIIIPFRKEVDMQNPKEWIAIDINESNVTAVSSNPHVLRVDHELRTVHTTYFIIRRRIQKLAKYKPKTAQRLLKKYSDREKRRTGDLCHKISKKIVDFAKQHNLGIVMENLKGIRKSIKKGRQMNRRLHSWNFRMLQFYVDYKAKLNGLPVEYVNPRGTSSLCPICGGRLAPNGHRLLKCLRCGYEKDRDVTAGMNMLRMRGVPLPLKAINEAKAEMERIVYYSYPITVSMDLAKVIEDASRMIEELRSAVSKELKERYENLGIKGIIELLEEEIEELDAVMTAGAELQFEPTAGDLKQVEELCSERGGMKKEIDSFRGIRFFTIPVFEGGTMEQSDHLGFVCVLINITRGKGFLWLEKLRSERSALQEATFLLSKVM